MRNQQEDLVPNGTDYGNAIDAKDAPKRAASLSARKIRKDKSEIPPPNEFTQTVFYYYCFILYIYIYVYIFPNSLQYFHYYYFPCFLSSLFSLTYMYIYIYIYYFIFFKIIISFPLFYLDGACSQEMDGWGFMVLGITDFHLDFCGPVAQEELRAFGLDTPTNNIAELFAVIQCADPSPFTSTPNTWKLILRVYPSADAMKRSLGKLGFSMKT